MVEMFHIRKYVNTSIYHVFFLLVLMQILLQLYDSIDGISNGISSEAYLAEVSSSALIEDQEPSQPPLPMTSAISKFVILIAATSKPEYLDPGVRGRFAREISLPVPGLYFSLHCPNSQHPL